MKFKENLMVFSMGAVGYPILELLYRRRTHWSMAVAGGLCFRAIYGIHKRGGSLLSRSLRCAASVTAVEFGVGMVVNRLLKLGVWDYSKNRLNLMGQICPQFTGIWLGLSAVLSPLCRTLRLYFSSPMAYNLEKCVKRGESDAGENTRLTG